MRRAGIAAGLGGGAAVALAAFLARAPAPAPRAAEPPRPAEVSLAEAIATLGGELPPLAEEYAPQSIDVPFQPVPEPGTGALVALGLAVLPRLARPRAACHPAR